MDEIKDKLFNIRVNGWNTVEKEKVFAYSEDYISFLNSCKTERECVSFLEKGLLSHGFINISDASILKPGDKVFYNNHGKSLFAAVIGSDKLSLGFNIVGSHIDSPRLDLKPSPLYEKSNLALFKTHYYGGIKKYQWTTIPLCLKGVVCLTNGSCININIGLDEGDPVFTVTDLLPHLARRQEEKKLSDGVSGEDLNILVGSIPYSKEKVSDNVKLNILNILYNKYGFTEKDFGSAEIEAVPAFRASSLGLDSSMVGGYGQDDRACSYNNYRAILSVNNPKRTCISIFSDKEEIGSVGNTGMESHSFEVFVLDLLDKSSQNGVGVMDRAFVNSNMLSADVTSATDPTYESVDDLHNAAYLGYGMVMCKYTGAYGKSSASDANAEYVSYVRNIFEKNHLLYQYQDMGKVDEGGGGTIAYILANKGVNVVDLGVPILSMHSPFEVSSKFDIYDAYLCYYAFFIG